MMTGDPIRAFAAAALLFLAGTCSGVNPLADHKVDKFKSGQKGDSVPGQVQRLDLTSLLSNQVPPPEITPPADAGPEKEMVRAAINVISNEGLPIAVGHYSQIFGAIPKQPGAKETAPLTADDVRAGAKYLLGLIDGGSIKVKKGAQHSAGAWTPEIDKGQMTGGTVEIGGDLDAAKAAGRTHDYPKLSSQDQIADTVLHEASHMFYSYFSYQRGAKEQTHPEKIQEDFALRVFWTGLSPAGTCNPACSPFLIRKSPCHGDLDYDCYMYHLNDDGYGKSGNEDAARKIANELETSTNGTAYAKVLYPLVH